MSSKTPPTKASFASFIAGDRDNSPNKRPRFSGILNEPMVWSSLPPHVADKLGGGDLNDGHNRVLLEDIPPLIERFRALYKHYHINPKAEHADTYLILSLANDFVPGFEVRAFPKRGRGRPRKWRSKISALLADIAVLKRTRAVSARGACRILVTSAKYAPRYGKENQNSLYRRYQEAKHFRAEIGDLGRFMAELAEAGHANLLYTGKGENFSGVDFIESGGRVNQPHDIGEKSRLKTRTTK
jgi:hypothetical protein